MIAPLDAKEDVLAALKKIIPAIRKRCRHARILIRGNSGFCREGLMALCEGEKKVYYVLGLAKNSVLVERVEQAMFWAAARRCLTGQASREFSEFEYQTQESWVSHRERWADYERRLVGRIRDAELEKLLRRTPGAVAAKRESLDIPIFSSQRICWS